MTQMKHLFTPLLAGLFLLSTGTGAASAEESADGDTEISILLFTKTAGSRHGPAIQAAHNTWPEIAEKKGWHLTITEDAEYFTGENLANYDVLFFANTTRNVLPEPYQREAFKEHIRGGGGFVGSHAATDTLYEWEWYGGLVGAYFAGHPPGTQLATIIVEDDTHPSTQHLGESFEINDEWYWWNENPRENVNVLARLDRTSHQVLREYRGDPEEDHPVIWYHEYDGGRVWYTAMGHPASVWEDERFQQMLIGAIAWAAGKQEGQNLPACCVP